LIRTGIHSGIQDKIQDRIDVLRRRIIAHERQACELQEEIRELEVDKIIYRLGFTEHVGKAARKCLMYAYFYGADDDAFRRIIREGR